MYKTVTAIALTSALMLSLPAFAGWHTVQGQAPILDSVAQARDDAVNDAIYNAKLEAGAQVSIEQDFKGGVLSHQSTNVKSSVPVRKVVVIGEQKTSGRVQVTVKVLLDESHVSHCAASSVKKAVLPVTFAYADQNAYLGSSGIDTINRELSSYIYSKIAKSPSLLVRNEANINLRGTNQNAAPGNVLTEEIGAIARQYDSQYVLTGTIESAAASDAGENVFDKLFYQRTRTLSFTVNLYEAATGELIYTKNYSMTSDWPFKQGDYLDLRSERFKSSAFGQRMLQLTDLATQEITQALQCRMPEATIIDVEDDGFIIDLGSESGITKGMKFSMIETSENYDINGEAYPQDSDTRGVYIVDRVSRNSAKLRSADLNDNVLNIRLNDKVVPIR